MFGHFDHVLQKSASQSVHHATSGDRESDMSPPMPPPLDLSDCSNTSSNSSVRSSFGSLGSEERNAMLADFDLDPADMDMGGYVDNSGSNSNEPPSPNNGRRENPLNSFVARAAECGDGDNALGGIENPQESDDALDIDALEDPFSGDDDVRKPTAEHRPALVLGSTYGFSSPPPSEVPDSSDSDPNLPTLASLSEQPQELSQGAAVDSLLAMQLSGSTGTAADIARIRANLESELEKYNASKANATATDTSRRTGSDDDSMTPLDSDHSSFGSASGSDREGDMVPPRNQTPILFRSSVNDSGDQETLSQHMAKSSPGMIAGRSSPPLNAHAKRHHHHQKEDDGHRAFTTGGGGVWSSATGNDNATSNQHCQSLYQNIFDESVPPSGPTKEHVHEIRRQLASRNSPDLRVMDTDHAVAVATPVRDANGGYIGAVASTSVPPPQLQQQKCSRRRCPTTTNNSNSCEGSYPYPSSSAASSAFDKKKYAAAGRFDGKCSTSCPPGCKHCRRATPCVSVTPRSPPCTASGGPHRCRKPFASYKQHSHGVFLYFFFGGGGCEERCVGGGDLLSLHSLRSIYFIT